MNEPPPAAITTTLARKVVAGVRRGLEAARHALERIQPLAEVEHRRERLYLFHEPFRKLLASHDR